VRGITNEKDTTVFAPVFLCDDTVDAPMRQTYEVSIQIGDLKSIMDPLNHILGLEVLDILWIDSASEEPFFRLCSYWVGTEVIKISCSDTATFQRIDEPGNEIPGIGMAGTQRCF
jgi:hypothetical protein